MPELVIPAETPATESAPVTNLSELTPEQRQEWRKTGEFPKPKAADSAPAKEETPEVPEVADSEPAPAAPDSAPATKQEPHRKTKEDTERRFREILDENKTLKQRLEEVERRTAPRETKQESQPAAAAKVDAKPVPSIEDLDEKGEFKYKTIPELNQAVSDYYREQLSVQIKAELAAAQKAEAEIQQKQLINQGWIEKVEEARKRYTDFDVVALNTNIPIPIKEGSVVDLFTLRNPHGADVLYALAKDDCAELRRISKLHPMDQHEQLIEIARTFAEPKKEPAPPKTSAPRPPSEVGGRGTQPTDSALAAVQANDYRAAKATWNRQALGK